MSSKETNRVYLLIGAILVAGTLGSYVVRPAAAADALSASAGVISVGGTVQLTQTLDSPATGVVNSIVVIEPDGDTCAAKPAALGSTPLTVTYPTDFMFVSGSGDGICDTSNVGIYQVHSDVTVGLQTMHFDAQFQTNFFVLPESPVGVAAITGSSLAALGAFIGLRRLKGPA